MAGATTATAAQFTGPNSANANTVPRPTTAEIAFFSALMRARLSSSTSPRPATSITPSAAPK